MTRIKLLVGTTAPEDTVRPSILAERAVLAEPVEAGAKADADDTRRENNPIENLIVILLIVYCNRDLCRGSVVRKDSIQETIG